MSPKIGDDLMRLKKKRLAFVFSGIGAQWKTMGSGLFREEKTFNRVIRECDRLFGQYSGWSIAEELTRPEDHSRVEESLIAHPCNFALQVALVRLLYQWGVFPGAVIGHSSGEVAAACTAGILSLEDAVKVVWQHCLLMEKVIGKGSMLHISLPLPELKDVMKEYGENIIAAAVNSCKSTVLSGDAESLRRISAGFKKKNIFCRLLRVDIPFHSPQIQPYLEEFRQSISDIKANAANIPVYSTLYGETAADGDYNASYWTRHIRETILFAPAINHMITDGCKMFMEIGPHPVISTAVQECLQENKQTDYLVIGTLKRDKPEKPGLLNALAHLHVNEYRVDWDKLNTEDQHRGRSLIRCLEAEKNKTGTPELSRLSAAPGEKRKELLVHLIHASIKKISRQTIVPPDDPDVGFFAMGLNSTMVIQLKSELEKKLQLSLANTVVFDYPNTGELMAHLNERLFNHRGEVVEEGPAKVDTRSVSGPRPSAANDPIAIIGMGCRFPGRANNPSLFWELLEKGKDAISEIPPTRWNFEDYYDADPGVPGKTVSRWGGLVSNNFIMGFDANFFGISPGEATALDPQQRMLLEVSWQALENAGIPPHSLRNQPVGVYMGISTDDYKGSHLFSTHLETIDAYSASGSMFSSASGRLSYFFGFRGPNISVDTACSSSLTALHLACRALGGGECKLALAGGVNALLAPNLFVYFTKLGALSPEGRCKTFDASADGYVRGEGCGVVVLKPLSAAQKDGSPILAIIRGTALNQDGASTSFIAPNGLAQRQVLRQALDYANLTPKDIDYIEAHGTGTSLGDPIELEALNQVYGHEHTKEHPLLTGSVKTNIGHLEAAAGMASLIKVVLMMQKEHIPPHLNFSRPTPMVDWENIAIKVNTHLTPWKRGKKVRRAGINSFGFSGTNAHVIVEEAPRQTRGPTDMLKENMERSYILTLSAKNRSALQGLVLRYRQYFSSSVSRLDNICYTANTGGSHFSKRLAVVGKTPGEMKKKLSGRLSGPPPNTIGPGNKKIVFLFTGQGSQYREMGKQLYERRPVFQQAVERCDGLFRPYIRRSIIHMLYTAGEDTESGGSIIHQTNYSQPLIFSIEYALAALWESWGITPAAVLGHSIGEFAAAVTAGVLDVEDAVKLVAERGRLMHGTPGRGVMASVIADEKTIRPELENYKDKVVVAAVNAPDSIVISGEEPAVKAVIRQLKQKDIKTHWLDVSHAFHSPLMSPILEPFERAAAEVAFSLPAVSYISGTTGKPIDREVAGAGYWVRHITEPVRFRDAVCLLEEEGWEIFLEIGAAATLSSMAPQCVSNPRCVFLPSMRKDKDDEEQILETLAQLYSLNIDIDWRAFAGPLKGGKKVSLPNYPFQRKRYWLNPVNQAHRGYPADKPGTIKQAGNENAGGERFVYSTTWEEKPMGPAKEIPHGTYLIFSDSSRLGEYLKQSITNRGFPCVIVPKGEQIDWEKSSPLRVLYLWGLDAVVSDNFSSRGINMQQEEVCGNLLDIVKKVALIKQASLWIVTRYAQMVEPQSQLSLFQATLWGLGKVIALEYPHMWGGLIDLDDAAGKQAAEAILKTITVSPGEDRVLFRKGKRYVFRLENRPLSSPGSNPRAKPLVDPEGTYLVTGGTGGLGLVTAGWLKEKGARQIVLTSRTGTTPGVRQYLEKLDREGDGANEKGNVNIVVIKADVSDARQVERLIDRINRTMPALKGIIHAAGVLADRMINEQNWENFARVLKPKVNGAWNLHLYTRHLSLNFFILFSSAASLLGNPGQSSYGAANAFLDAFAAYRKTLGLTGLSINWGPWGTAGMATSKVSIKKNLNQQGFSELKPGDAVPLMEKFLQAPHPGAQIAIIDCNWGKYVDYLSQSRGAAFLEKLVIHREPPPKEPRILKEINAAPLERKKALLTIVVLESAAFVLGMEDTGPLDLQVPLMEQGFDSLMAVEFRNVLAKKLGLSLAVTLLFNAPTIPGVVTHILNIIVQEELPGNPAPKNKEEAGLQSDHLDNLDREELEELIGKELDKKV
jgi:acyl transferase domain-containing protein/acyl carrier protein